LLVSTWTCSPLYLCPSIQGRGHTFGSKAKTVSWASICGGISVLYGLNVICWKTYGTQPKEEYCTMFHIFQNVHGHSLPKVLLANCLMLSLRPNITFFFSIQKNILDKKPILSGECFFPNQTKCTNHIEIN